MTGKTRKTPILLTVAALLLATGGIVAYNKVWGGEWRRVGFCRETHVVIYKRGRRNDVGARLAIIFGLGCSICNKRFESDIKKICDACAKDLDVCPTCLKSTIFKEGE